jgi:cytochrome c oxidase assembly protein subunit 15
MLHFSVSMVLIGLATVLVGRLDEGDEPASPVVLPLLRRLAVAQVAVLAVVVYLGTVVTGSGPHAGDTKARRTGLDPETVSQFHADAVFVLVGLTIGLLVALRATNAPLAATRAVAVLLGLELARG